jgi:glycosyltransferase involved in cell wall biosynthesis
MRERQGLVARVLTLSTLFPNAAQPNHGVFVENRLKETLALGGIEATVVAPVPYFPFAHRIFGRYAAFARAPLREVRQGVDIWHPRYAVLPKCAQFTPASLYRCALASVRALQAEGQRFDVIDAHYFYPDGVAAARLADTLKLPLVITGRGTDLTLIPQAAGPRAQIRWAAWQASALVTVCDDLRRRLVELGAPEQRILVLRNGVDLRLFTPGDREAARAAWGLNGFTWLSVGSLIARKGHDLAIEALTHCPDCTLVIAGDGPLRPSLEALARFRTAACRACTPRRTSWCWPPRARAGPTSCSKRWRAARPWLRRPSTERWKSFARRPPARSFRGARWPRWWRPWSACGPGCRLAKPPDAMPRASTGRRSAGPTRPF